MNIFLTIFLNVVGALKFSRFSGNCDYPKIDQNDMIERIIEIRNMELILKKLDSQMSEYDKCRFLDKTYLIKTTNITSGGLYKDWNFW